MSRLGLLYSLCHQFLAPQRIRSLAKIAQHTGKYFKITNITIDCERTTEINTHSSVYPQSYEVTSDQWWKMRT